MVRLAPNLAADEVWRVRGQRWQKAFSCVAGAQSDAARLRG